MSTAQEIKAAIFSGNEESARTLLQNANDAYYTDGTSQLTDAEFDGLRSAYMGKFGLPLRTAPRMTPAKGRTDRQAGVPHDWPLLSGWLAKAANLSETADWLGKAADTHNPGPLIGSPKWDGLSVVITYNQHGHVMRALTRGDDGLGVDVTRVFAGESHFGEHDFGIDRFGIKYEVVMTWAATELMSTALGKTYKNPRNTVAGIIASDDSSDRRQYITLVPLDVEWDGCEDDRLSRLSFLQAFFVGEPDGDIPPVFAGNGSQPTPFAWYEINSWDGDGEVLGVQEVYDELLSWRSNPEFDFMIDGVVFEFSDDNDIERLGGRNNDCPDYAIATKFPSMVGRTKVLSLDWDLGNTGRLTPVVNYEPVTLDGRTFSRTSIANMTRFDQLQLCPGTPIVIEIRGDILAWVDRDGDDLPDAVPFPPPENCSFTYNDAGQRVFAYVEAPLDGRCERMMVKCGIKGIRIETISKLVDAGLVTSLADMWTISEKISQIVLIPGLGASSAEILCSAIDNKLSQALWDWEILSSVGINGVGRTLAREALKVLTLDDMIDLAGTAVKSSASLQAAIGMERSAMLMDGIVTFIDDLKALKEIALTKSRYNVTKEISGTYDGPMYKVVVTGDMERWERDEFKTLIEAMGHKMVGSISSKTDYLITNTPNSGTVKNKRAQELGVEIITEVQAIEILGISEEAASVRKASSTSLLSPTMQAGTLDEL